MPEFLSHSDDYLKLSENLEKLKPPVKKKKNSYSQIPIAPTVQPSLKTAWDNLYARRSSQILNYYQQMSILDVYQKLPGINQNWKNIQKFLDTGGPKRSKLATDTLTHTLSQDIEKTIDYIETTSPDLMMRRFPNFDEFLHQLQLAVTLHPFSIIKRNLLQEQLLTIEGKIAQFRKKTLTDVLAIPVGVFLSADTIPELTRAHLVLYTLSHDLASYPHLKNFPKQLENKVNEVKRFFQGLPTEDFIISLLNFNVAMSKLEDKKIGFLEDLFRYLNHRMDELLDYYETVSNEKFKQELPTIHYLLSRIKGKDDERYHSLLKSFQARLQSGLLNAALSDNRTAVQTFLDFGADPSQIKSNGQPLFRIALANHHPEMAKLLHAHHQMRAPHEDLGSFESHLDIIGGSSSSQVYSSSRNPQMVSVKLLAQRYALKRNSTSKSLQGDSPSGADRYSRK